MFKLVVLSALLAVATAKPGYLHGGIAAYAAPGPAVAYAAPSVVATAPLTATAYTKNVHYASTPVVTGYTSTVLKPDLGSLVTSEERVTKEKVLAPGRSVATITPQITQVEPEVTVEKVSVDVPVATPVVNKVATIHTGPAVATYTAAAPAVATYAAAAPAVATYAAAAPTSYAGPAVATYTAGPATYAAAAPAVATYAAAAPATYAAPAVATYAAAAPAVATYAAGPTTYAAAAPAVATYAAGPATYAAATYAAAAPATYAAAAPAVATYAAAAPGVVAFNHAGAVHIKTLAAPAVV